MHQHIKRYRHWLILPLTRISILAYASGFAGLFVTYAPTVEADVVSKALRHSHREIVLGTLGLVISGSIAGTLFASHRKLAFMSIGLIAFALGGGLIFLSI